KLLSNLHHGSSVNNPIDFLATGTAEQLGIILDAVDNEFDEIDGSVVVFGTTGMWSVSNVYDVLHQKMKSCRKPIFPILPSLIQAAEEVSRFQSQGGVNFTDEVSFGYVLSRVYRTHSHFPDANLPLVIESEVRFIMDHAENGYLKEDECLKLLSSVGIDHVPHVAVRDNTRVVKAVERFGFPVAMKVIGPLHKTDVGGVQLSLRTVEDSLSCFNQFMKIENAEGVIVQPMISGQELFIGAKRDEKFGHIILCGIGGVFVEVLRDISSGISPLSREEALTMIRRLRGYSLIAGARGKEGVNEELIVDTLLAVSALLEAAPEIDELDMNPLMGTMSYLKAVDVRISLLKK
ncbi:MAG TPA: acetate--CoA ligase family protein, partial [Bacteroidia bacterium]|nr:acetate--CoA ligase family protein [Bacteroidia bacterium]